MCVYSDQCTVAHASVCHMHMLVCHMINVALICVSHAQGGSCLWMQGCVCMSTYHSVVHVHVCGILLTCRCHTRGQHKEETLIPLTSDPQTTEPSSDTLTSNPQDDARL